MRITFHIWLTASVLAGIVPSAAAQETGSQPVLGVRVVALQSDGSRGRDSGFDVAQKSGESFSAFVQAGLVDTPGQLCALRSGGMGGTITQRDKQTMQNALYVWKFTHAFVGYDGGRQTFDVDWQRFDRGASTPAVSGKHRLTLVDGESRVLDLVHGDGAAPCRTASAGFEVTAKVKEDPAFADTVLRYDLWLVRTARDGRQERRHVILTGLHGTDAAFYFPVVTSAVPKLQPDQYDLRVATRVAGNLRGRLTRDGRILMNLETSRSDNLERTGASATRPGRTGSGRKVLTAALNEAIEIELPPGNGYSSSPISEKVKSEWEKAGARTGGTQASRSEPVVVTNGALQVNYGPFFQGERLSVIIQVRKVDGEPEPGAVPPPAVAASAK